MVYHWGVAGGLGFEAWNFAIVIAFETCRISVSMCVQEVAQGLLETCC